jgi:hypothetical protein
MRFRYPSVVDLQLPGLYHELIIHIDRGHAHIASEAGETGAHPLT